MKTARLSLLTCILIISKLAATGEVIPEVATVADPSRYDLITPGMSKDQFALFVKQAEAGDPLALDAVFVAYLSGLGMRIDNAQARQWLARGYKIGAPVCMLYHARNLRGFRLDPSRRDPELAQQILIKVSAAIAPLAKSGNSMAMFVLSTCHNELGQQAVAIEWLLKAAEAGNAVAMVNLGVVFERGSGVEKDLKKSFEWTKKAGDAGSPVAQGNLGAKYFHGSGTEKNLNEAEKWARKAAENGDQTGQFVLGAMYRDGEGLPADFNEAARLFGLAAAQGQRDALAPLGKMFEDGLGGLPKDPAEAARLYDRAISMGNVAWPSRRLGILYGQGRGVPLDQVRAVELFRKSADAGDHDACHILNWHYTNGVGCKEDHVEAFRWIKKAAEGQCTRGYFEMGTAYLKGIGTPIDVAKAVDFLEKAGADKHKEAIDELGMIYFSGRGDVKQDMKKSVHWFGVGAELGVPTCQYYLALELAQGWGVTVNAGKSHEWMMKSAAQGNEFAQNEVGVTFRDGRAGVPVDMKEAFEWFAKAAKNNAEAKRNLGKMFREGKGVVKDEAKGKALLEEAEKQQPLNDAVTPPRPPPEYDLEF